MTRSHKFGDKDHTGEAGAGHGPQDHLPRFFAKHGHPDQDPNKIKKNGHGKGNWGNAGEEVLDSGAFNFANARRRSNSSSISHTAHDFKSKFEVNELEPVFDESLHGAPPAAVEKDEDDADTLHKTETASSASSSEEVSGKN